MIRYILFIFSVLLFGSIKTYAQKDTLVHRNKLEEVIIYADKKLKNHSTGYKIVELKDSLLLKNTESFSHLLRFNAPIYIREYGAGGTSSANFRGTSASNTAVVWNGININSLNNAQTGFNSLTASLYDNLAVRSGGGSIEYGTGAIGGTIHLNDEIKFLKTPKATHQIVSSFGSYNTSHNLYKFNFSNQKLNTNIGIAYNRSDNDYKLLDTEFKNTNGQYENLSLNLSLGIKLSPYTSLKYYSSNYLADRHFSGELPNPTSANDKYKDIFYRNLLVFSYQKERGAHTLKAGYLVNEYRYFDDITIDEYDFGKSRRFILKYHGSHKFNSIRAKLTGITEFESAFGKTNKITERNRRNFSQAFIYNQKLFNKLTFDIKLRKDFNSDYTVPFTYAFGTNYKISSTLAVRANASTNYRVPSYNDLYWPGQGNLDLIPEEAKQGEVGIQFTKNNIKLDLGGFYINTTDKIVWTPNGDTNRPGIWVPINLKEVTNKGIELTLEAKKTYNKHTFYIRGNYNYVIAQDAVLKKQLIFVPKHTFNGALHYSYKKIAFNYQLLINDKVYTTESNSEDYTLPHFKIHNIGLDYKIYSLKNTSLVLGLKVNNLLNEKYSFTPSRLMPNRNYNFNINYKF